ncbi:MAG: hypothetical protein CMH54_15545 [Myxococcales bacterium]|nr:hypothetical protein [Myxococcales bacterium]
MNPGDAAVGVGLEWGYDTGACRGSTGDGGSQIAFVIHILLTIALVVGPTWLVHWSKSRRRSVLWLFVALFIGTGGSYAFGLAGGLAWIPAGGRAVVFFYFPVVLPLYLGLSLRFGRDDQKIWSTYWSRHGFSYRLLTAVKDVDEAVQGFPGIHNYFRYRLAYDLERLRISITGERIIPDKVVVADRNGPGDTVRVLLFPDDATKPIATWVIMAWFDSGSAGVSGMDEERESFNLLKRTLLARMNRMGKGFRFKRRQFTRRYIARSEEVKVDEIEALLERPGVAEGMGKLIRSGSVTLDYYKAGRSDGLRCVMSLHPADFVPVKNVRFDQSHIDTMLDIFPRIRER